MTLIVKTSQVILTHPSFSITNKPFLVILRDEQVYIHGLSGSINWRRFISTKKRGEYIFTNFLPNPGSQNPAGFDRFVYREWKESKMEEGYHYYCPSNYYCYLLFGKLNRGNGKNLPI